MQARPRLLSFTAMISLCALLAGCNDPYVQRTMQHDRESTAFALNSYAEREGRCSENLAAISRDVAEQWQDDVDTLPRSVDGVGEYFQKDVGEWPEKTSLPREEFQRLLAGDIDTILWALPRLAF
ncbi:MAG: hypothetical protein JSU68_08345 [Phycisphaerales bacterium]|nr:MAG: hypothetical protein JSU68_08345 [Phycisphaerales bacterium]